MARGIWKELSNRAALVLSNLVELSGRVTPRPPWIPLEHEAELLARTRPWVDKYGQLEGARFDAIMRSLQIPGFEKGTIRYNRLKWWVEKQHGRFSTSTEITSKMLYDRIFGEIPPERQLPRYTYHLRLREIEALEAIPITPDQINYHIRTLKDSGYLILSFTSAMLLPGQKMPVYPGWRVTRKAIDWYMRYRGPRPGWPVEVPAPVVPAPEVPVTPPRFLRMIINYTTPSDQPSQITIIGSIEVGTITR